VDGLLFSPNDPDDLARQAISLLRDVELSQRLAESAAAHVREKFTWHEAQKKLGKVYERLAPSAHFPSGRGTSPKSA
jgi:glycosyltransferase involved in cell wall biosynthesis